jgi:hypothetical protein
MVTKIPRLSAGIANSSATFNPSVQMIANVLIVYSVVKTLMTPLSVPKNFALSAIKLVIRRLNAIQGILTCVISVVWPGTLRQGV